MIDKTVLELVDRLVATTKRATMAETEAEKWKNQNAVNIAKLSEADAKIATLTGSIQELEAKVKSQESSKLFWYNEAQKFEKQLKELKDDTVGD